MTKLIKSPNDILNYTFDELCNKFDINKRYSDEDKKKFLKYELEKEIDPHLKKIFNKSWFDGKYSLILSGTLCKEFTTSCFKNIEIIYKQHTFRNSIKRIENTSNFFNNFLKIRLIDETNT